MAASRLDIFSRTARSRLGVDVRATEHLGRYLSYVEQASDKIEQLLDDQPKQVDQPSEG
jgi:hypothetical protein